MFPMIIIFVISYYIAALIMNVFQTVSVTLLQCLYIDLDISSQQKSDVTADLRPDEIQEIIEALKVKTQMKKLRESALKGLLFYEQDEA
jgi:hypothetical protein